jgi:hypothetical protein
VQNFGLEREVVKEKKKKRKKISLGVDTNT